MLALIFATHTIVLVPSLLAFGQLSDRFGRWPVILSADPPNLIWVMPAKGDHDDATHR
jgi:hypothetical protein